VVSEYVPLASMPITLTDWGLSVDPALVSIAVRRREGQWFARVVSRASTMRTSAMDPDPKCALRRALVRAASVGMPGALRLGSASAAPYKGILPGAGEMSLTGKVREARERFTKAIDTANAVLDSTPMGQLALDALNRDRSFVPLVRGTPIPDTDGEWRCQCKNPLPGYPSYDTSVNPRHHAMCRVCGAHRPPLPKRGTATGASGGAWSCLCALPNAGWVHQCAGCLYLSPWKEQHK